VPLGVLMINYLVISCSFAVVKSIGCMAVRKMEHRYRGMIAKRTIPTAKTVVGA
jgi:hypothetical protein